MLARTETKLPTSPRLRANRVARGNSRAKIDPSVLTASKHISHPTGRSVSYVGASTSITTVSAVRRAQRGTEQRRTNVLACHVFRAGFPPLGCVRSVCQAQLARKSPPPLAQLCAATVRPVRWLTTTRLSADVGQEPTISAPWWCVASWASTSPATFLPTSNLKIAVSASPALRASTAPSLVLP